MSAESTLVFYGIRTEVPLDRVEELDTNTHPLIKKARAAGLHYYGGNFAEPDEKYYLFVGTKLDVIGAENASEIRLTDQRLFDVLGTTRKKLSEAQIPGEPHLYVQWMPDAS